MCMLEKSSQNLEIQLKMKIRHFVVKRPLNCAETPIRIADWHLPPTNNSSEILLIFDPRKSTKMVIEIGMQGDYFRRWSTITIRRVNRSADPLSCEHSVQVKWIELVFESKTVRIVLDQIRPLAKQVNPTKTTKFRWERREIAQNRRNVNYSPSFCLMNETSGDTPWVQAIK